MTLAYNHGCSRVNSETPLQRKNFGCRVAAMVHGERLATRMQQAGISQSELARRVGVTQQTIYKLISGLSRSSTHLHLIARELLTTPAYLTGETDDPDVGAPPPPPAPTVQIVTMQVCWPSEEALAEMFEAQLEAFARLEGGELARALAKRLPKAVARLQGQRLIVETVADDGETAIPESAATARPEVRKARRT